MADNGCNIHALVTKYTNQLPIGPEKREKKTRIALLGSQGVMGSRIKRALLKSSDVIQLYCFDPDGPLEPKQSGKATKVRIDFLKPLLGIESRNYERYTEKISMVIHNAWEADCTRSLASYEPGNIASLISVVQLCVDSDCARLAFVSSMASMDKFAAALPDEALVPERVIAVADVSCPSGYGLSMLAGERILSNAAHVSSVPVTILRVGQIWAPEDARSSDWWLRTQWPCALVTASRAMKLIPTGFDDIRWLAADDVAEIAAELVMSDSGRCSVYNIVHPQSWLWNDFVGLLQARFQGSKVVPLAEWISVLEQRSASAGVVGKLSAAEIARFFKDMAVAQGANLDYETAHVRDKSKTFRRLQPITGDGVRAWMAAWGEKAAADGGSRPRRRYRRLDLSP